MSLSLSKPGTIQELGSRSGLTATLKDYQCEGIASLLKHLSRQLSELPSTMDSFAPYRVETGCGKGLFDATGLGKSVQTLGFCAAMKSISKTKHPLSNHGMARRLDAGYPVLVVCPMSVLLVWTEQLKTHYPSAKVGVFHGVHRRDVISTLSEDPTAFDFILTSKDTLIHSAGLVKVKALQSCKSKKRTLDETSSSTLSRGCLPSLAWTIRPLTRHAKDIVSLEARLAAPPEILTLPPTLPMGDRPSLDDSRMDMVHYRRAVAIYHCSLPPVWERDPESFEVLPPMPSKEHRSVMWSTSQFLFHFPFAALVIDEVHEARNPSTHYWRSLNLLCQDPHLFRLGLTATPFNNSVRDYAAIMGILGFDPCSDAHPGHLSSLIHLLSPGGGDDKYRDDGDDVSSLKSRMLKEMRDRCFISRPKSILGSCLPSLTEVCMEAKLSCLESRIYTGVYKETVDAFETFMGTHGAARFSTFSVLLEKLLRLRQACTHPGAMLGVDTVSKFYDVEKAHLMDLSRSSDSAKREERCPRCPPYDNPEFGPVLRMESAKFSLLRYSLMECMESGNKSLVVTQWKGMGDLLEIYLLRHGIPSLRFDGSMSTLERQHALRTFRSCDMKEWPVLILTLKSGGLGLTITEASRVFFLDLWYNPFAHHQARDRVWRLGQTKRVVSTTFVSAFPVVKDGKDGSRSDVPDTFGPFEALENEAKWEERCEGEKGTMDHILLGVHARKVDSSTRLVGDLGEFEICRDEEVSPNDGVSAKEVMSIMGTLALQFESRGDGIPEDSEEDEDEKEEGSDDDCEYHASL